MIMPENSIHLPETDKPVVVILSGGLDSSTVLLAAIAQYGDERLRVISFLYGQRQRIELWRARQMCKTFGLTHKYLDISVLGEIVKDVSANIEGTSIEMPTIKDVLGDPAPVTYVPNRNMIMFSLAAAYAEAEGAEVILCGLQSNDEYNYHDTTQRWCIKFNHLLGENRKHLIQLYVPLIDWNKTREVAWLKERDFIRYMYMTLTCYNPTPNHESCGRCPSCAERIKAFMENKIADPLDYAIDIPWILEEENTGVPLS